MAAPLQQSYESDFRCEFELPKFVDLRQAMMTRAQKHNLVPYDAGRETAITAGTDSRKSHNKQANSKIDANFDWFQQDHDFKIMTRAQM